jgi:hypothetical protein
MGSVVGGDITEITYNHPTLGSGTWLPKAGEDSTFDPGGFRGDDDANNVDGAGRNIKKLNRVKWSFEGVVSWDANSKNELDMAKKLAGSPEDADWTITSINGTVWGGKGSPVGDIQGNGNAATMSIKLAGGGEMKKIVG